MSSGKNESQVLLNAYRRDNLLLTDKINELLENVIPQKDILINDLKAELGKKKRDIDYWKNKYTKRGWFS